MAGRSSCPECGTILRIRDRSFVGRKVSCPECKAALRVEATDRDDEFVTSRFTVTEVATPNDKSQRAKTNRFKPTLSTAPRRASFSRVFHSPLMAAWLLAIAVVALVAVLLLNPRLRVTSYRSNPARKLSDLPVESPSAPDSSMAEVAVRPAVPQTIIPAPTKLDDGGSISAMEPANVEGPLPSPPLPVVSNAPEPPTPPLPIKIDVEGKMAQKLVSYKQPKIARRVLLEALEEQLGAPIRYEIEDLGAEELDEKVAFDLENTTIGDVIQVVAKAADWQIVIEDTGIRLTRKK